MAVARSLSSMTSLRFHRSTKAPAIGLNKTEGRNAKKLMVASAEAFPVTSQAQIVKANQVIALPMSESICPSQTMVKERIPVCFISLDSVPVLYFPPFYKIVSADYPLCLTASYTINAVETDTFKELTLPIIGICTCTSAFDIQKSVRPTSSVPTAMAIGWVISTSE